MNYENTSIDYALRNGFLDVAEECDTDTKARKIDYSRKRSAKALRKRGKKAPGPGCGIGARRNRQYT